MNTNQDQIQQIAQYVNNTLANYAPAADLLPIKPQNCVQALHDGVLLCYMMNCMSSSGPVIKQSQLKRTKATLFHKMDQVNKALQASKKAGLNIVNVRAENIVQKKQNAIIGLFNQITRQKPGAKPTVAKPKEPKQLPTYQTKRVQDYQQTHIQSKVQTRTQNNHWQQNTQNAQHKKSGQKQQEKPQQMSNYQQRQHKKTQQTEEEIKKKLLAAKIQQQNIFRNKILDLQINQNQTIPNLAEKGYLFQNTLAPQIVVLCGSLRKGSVNRGIITCLQQIKSNKYFINIHFHIPDLSILPLINQDIQTQGKIPKAVIDLQQITRKSLGIIIATPQYNGTFSAIVKNAFDWLSKSYTNKELGSPLQGKKIGIVSTSFLTQNQIKDTIEMGQNFKCVFFRQNFYIPLSSGAFKMEQGKLIKQQQIDRLAFWYQQFSYFILSGKPNPEPSPRFIMQ